MTENKQNSPSFAGTYFDRDAVLRLSRFLRIASWIVAGAYVYQFVLNIVVFTLQWSRGFLYIGGPTDVLQQIYWQVQPTLAGLIFFASLQAISQGLLILLDIEDNTRRAARTK